MTSPLSIGKFRSFQQCTSAAGTFTCLALDHRQNLKKINPDFQLPQNLSRFKLDVVRHLAPSATSVLLDPEVSAAQSIAANVLPGNRGLIVALESTGYVGDASNRQTRLIPGWSVEKIRRMGASMAKLLIYYHPDAAAARRQETVIRKVAEKCRKYDLAFMLEILTYPLKKAATGAKTKKTVVTESARLLGSIPGVDLLKIEFPGDAEDLDEHEMTEACRQISQSIQIPWILLSSGINFDRFVRQTEIACQAGASGVAVGRAVWQEAVYVQGEERRAFLDGEAMRRLEQLNAVCCSAGRPWTDFFTASADFDWYQNY